MADETLRRNLDRVFDPGPDYPHPLLLSRTMAMLDTSAAPAGRAGRRQWPLPSMRLAAIAIAVIVTVVATAAFLALHRVTAPVPVHTPPFRVNAPGVGACSSSCWIRNPVFVSSTVGLLIESTTPGTCDATCPPQTSVLFRTDDGGLHWKAQHAWKPDDQIGRLIASPDASELLIVGDQSEPVTILYSQDGGITWAQRGLPPGAGQAVETACKGGMCSQVNVRPQLYFLNPREGWVISQEQSYNVADLFHTTDSGAHWTRAARIDVRAELNLDLTAGITYPNTYFTHSLPGQFVFQDANTGWFITMYGGSGGTPPFLYRTVDGGMTWRPQSNPTVRGMTSDGFVSQLTFFNQREGVIEVGTSFSYPSGDRYVFTTTDGGSHWSEPVKLRTDASIQFVDASHWVGWPYQGGWMSTADGGRHWTVTPGAGSSAVAPAANAGLPQSYGKWFYFRDPANGWAYFSQDFVPSGTALYHTVDGGVNWAPLSLPDLE